MTPKLTLKDIIFNGKKFSDVVVPTPYGVDLLPASSGAHEMVALGEARMNLFLQNLLKFSANYNVILFDCASGINSSVTCFLKAAPFNLIVATPAPTSIMDVYALLKVIQQQGLNESPALVVNMAETTEQGKKVHNALNQVARRYLANQMRLLGIIPQDPEVGKALTRRQPFIDYAPEHPIAEAFHQIARNLIHNREASAKLSELDFRGIAEGLVAERGNKE